MIHEIRSGDGLAGLHSMAGTADLVFWDPPWGVTQAEWDRPLDWPAWWSGIDRALAPDGVLVVKSGLPLACLLMPLATRPYRYDLVWGKNRASGFLNANRAPLRAHELLLVFGGTRYEPQRTTGHAPMNAAVRTTHGELYGVERTTHSKAGNTDRYQTSVMWVPVVPNDGAGGEPRIHATQTPTKLLRWIVRAYAPPAGLVVDPCCGSGAMIVAAREEGRSAIGWELHEPHAESARQWLDDSGRQLVFVT